jgi:hypothetical protein
LAEAKKYDIYASSITKITEIPDEYEIKNSGEIYFNYGPSSGWAQGISKL